MIKIYILELSGRISREIACMWQMAVRVMFYCQKNKEKMTMDQNDKPPGTNRL